MADHQDEVALRDRLEMALGREHAATLLTMLPQRDDVATKADVGEVRSEIADFRTEVASLRSEMEYRFATKDYLLELRRVFDLSGRLSGLSSRLKQPRWSA